MSARDYDKMLKRKEALKRYLKQKRQGKRDFNFCLIHANGVKNNKYVEMLRPRLVCADAFFVPS